jgi:hypothetical protein
MEARNSTVVLPDVFKVPDVKKSLSTVFSYMPSHYLGGHEAGSRTSGEGPLASCKEGNMHGRQFKASV